MGDRYSQTCHPCSLPCHLRAGTLLSWKNFETHSSWCLGGNVPSPTLVTPAEAGAQGNRRDITTARLFPVSRSCLFPWAPASAGVTSLWVCCSLQNQVLSLFFAFKILTQQSFQQLLSNFPRTAVARGQG